MSENRTSIPDPSARGSHSRARRRPLRRAWRSLLAAGCALVAMGAAAPAAMADPWPCDGSGYMSQFDAQNPVQGTRFNRAVRQPNGSYVMNTRGTYANHLNAIGFRAHDGFMYGMDNTIGQIVRIQYNAGGDSPIFTPIGFPAGSGLDLGAGIVIGAVLSDGTYLLWGRSGAGTPSGAIFDVSGPTAQLVSTVTLNPGSPEGFQGDFAISAIDGQIYGVNRDDPADPNSTFGVYRWTIANGVLTRGPRVAGGANAGAAWFQPDGMMIIYANAANSVTPEGPGVYAVDVAAGTRTFLGTGPAFSNADGAACANGIALTKSAAPRVLLAGRELVYTHTITSRALVDAQVEFRDQLPPGLTFVPGGVTVTPAMGAPNDYGGNSALAVSGTIAPQQTVTITARVMVSPSHACDVDVLNQSQVTFTLPNTPPIIVRSDDPTTPADPTDPTSIHVNCSADVAIVKTATTSPVVPGEPATFTFVATNHGPSTATNVQVTDMLPAEFTFSSASPGCGVAGGTLTCTVASLAPGATQSFTVTGQVASDLDECLSNTATVTSGTPDPVQPNNTSTICVPINAVSDLSITKDPSSPTVASGGQVVYTLVARNNGPSDDPSVTVTDPLTLGLAVVSATPSQGSCTTISNVVSCDLGALRSGGSAQVLVTINVANQVRCLTNIAFVRGAMRDPNLANNSESAEICVEPPPPPRFDLVVQKTANVTRPYIGQPVTYRIVVTNNGPDGAPAVRLTDTLDAPVTVVSVRASQGSCERRLPMVCQLGTIAAKTSVTITVVAGHREPSCRQGNAASAVGDGTDTNTANNMDRVDVCPRRVRLRISKVASREVVSGGQALSYRIRVRNPTAGAARNVKVCDRLPSGLRFLSSAPRSRRERVSRCWTVNRLSPRTSRTFTVTVRAARGAIGSVTNTATASSPTIAGRVVRARDRVRVLGAATPVTG